MFLNLECYCGPYIEPGKLKTLQSVYNGNMVTVLKDVLEDVIRCAIDPKTVFGFLKPGNYVYMQPFCLASHQPSFVPTDHKVCRAVKQSL